MTEEQHRTGRNVAVGSALMAIPVAVGIYATTAGFNVEQIGTLVASVGVLPALVILAFWANHSRENRMASRLDIVEDRYHGETVALARQCITALEKNTDAFKDLHQTVIDQHQQTVLLLTRNVPGGSMSMAVPLMKHGEIEMMAEAIKRTE